MNSQEKASLRYRFQLKVYKSDGQAFEDLFTQIMNYAESDFQSIKPWGNIGDRKNDGYIKSKGIFYQVFAPENIKNSYPDFVKKLKTDFSKLLAQWSPVNEFYFVVNDKYKGVHADCEKAFQRIREDNSLDESGFLTSKDLENTLFSLDDDEIYSVVGFPDPSNINLDYSVLNEIVSYLMSISLKHSGDSSNVLPDWDEKISFNELGAKEEYLLTNGSFQIASLDEYMNNQSVSFADDIKTKLREVYIELKESGLSGNGLFWKMVDTISPRNEATFESCAIVVMAKYFETCDIFEEPK